MLDAKLRVCKVDSIPPRLEARALWGALEMFCSWKQKKKEDYQESEKAEEHHEKKTSPTPG